MEAIRVIAEDLVLLDWGPTTLTVAAWEAGEARPVMAAVAAAKGMECLCALADFAGYLRLPAAKLSDRGKRPDVVRRAAEAARQVGLAAKSFMTPMAAVAGALADCVADAAWDLGADRVIVNNGGDIALRLGPGQEAKVGLTLGPGLPVAHRLLLRHGDGIGGVATSGWQGRSFSLGVADQVGVWGASAALADAAATCLASGVNVSSPVVKRMPADSLEPGCGLGARPVTVGVGKLSEHEVRQALAAGERLAGRLLAALPLEGVHIRLAEERLLLAKNRARLGDEPQTGMLACTC